MSNSFYKLMTKRNIGIFNNDECEKFRTAKIALAGVGGIGGLAAERIVRLGCENIKIADPETFEPTNLNRQFCCSTKTLNNNKAEIIGKALIEINPSVKVEILPQGITEENVEDFLQGTDIAIDAMDISVPYTLRSIFYKIARKLNLVVITANAIGFGATLFVFDPNGMSHDEFFKAPASAELSKYKMPLDRMCPVMPDYADPNVVSDIVDGKNEYMPTVSPGVGLASLLMVTEVVNRLIFKKQLICVPQCLVMDLLSKTCKVVDFSNDQCK